MIRVRPATVADATVLLALVCAMHAEAPAYRHQPFDIDKVQRLIADCTAGADIALLVAVDDNAGVIGFLAMLQVESLFGSAVEYHDLGVFVEPEYRGSSAAIRLFNNAFKWVGERGGGVMKFGVTTGTNTAPAVRMLEKMGFLRSGQLLTTTVH